MQSERTHPVTYALIVARACGELAEEALSGGDLQKPLAAALSAAANSAALRLEAFVADKGAELAAELGRDIRHAQADLEAVAQIVGLAVIARSSPRGQACVQGRQERRLTEL